MITCTVCKKNKHSYMFYNNKSRYNGLDNLCKECRNDVSSHQRKRSVKKDRRYSEVSSNSDEKLSVRHQVFGLMNANLNWEKHQNIAMLPGPDFTLEDNNYCENMVLNKAKSIDLYCYQYDQDKESLKTLQEVFMNFPGRKSIEVDGTITVELSRNKRIHLVPRDIMKDDWNKFAAVWADLYGPPSGLKRSVTKAKVVAITFSARSKEGKSLEQHQESLLNKMKSKYIGMVWGNKTNKTSMRIACFVKKAA